MTKRSQQRSTVRGPRSRGARRLPGRLVLLGALIPLSTLFGQDSAPPKPEEDKNRELAETLIRKATTGTDEDLMDSIIRLMDSSARRLEIDFDAGDETQALQGQIVDRLDEAIKIAASQRRPQRSRRPSGDKRRMGEPGDRTKPGSVSGREQVPQTAGVQDSPPGGSVTDSKPASGTLEETRRAWGHLPLRDRDALIQGSDEAYLERYREWIERYYRALQESDE